MHWKQAFDVLMSVRPGPGALDYAFGFLTAARALQAWVRQRELLGIDVLRRYAGVNWGNDPLFHLRHHHYLSKRLTMRERADCAVTHYRHESDAYLAAYKEAVYRGSGLVLWSQAVGGRHYALLLRGATTLRHEGGTSVELVADGGRLTEMSFAWVPARLVNLEGDVVALITKNQSVHHESARLQQFREDFPQNSPHYFCLAALHGLVSAHGHPHIAGIRHDFQIAYEPSHAASFRHSYCELWQSFGGVACAADAFAMPVPLVPPPLSAVRAKHRKRAMERRRRWSEIAESVTAVTSSFRSRPPQAQTAERCLSTQVSRTSPPSRFHQLAAEKISTSL
jgi:uncharacterized protein VirK/YbjX